MLLTVIVSLRLGATVGSVVDSVSVDDGGVTCSLLVSNAFSLVLVSLVSIVHVHICRSVDADISEIAGKAVVVHAVLCDGPGRTAP